MIERKPKLAIWLRFSLIAISALVVTLAGLWAWSLFFPKPILINVSSTNAQSGIRTKSWEKAQLLDTLLGHSNGVNSVAISKDEKLIVSGSYDKTIKIWDLATKKLLRSLSGDSSIYSVAISPDGKTLVSGGDEKTIIWNLATGERQYTIANYGAVSLAINPDGQTFANDNQIWDLSTGRFVCTLSEKSKCDKSVIPKAIVFDSHRDVFDSNGNKFEIKQCWGIIDEYMRLVGANGEVRDLRGEILTNPSPKGYYRCVEYGRVIHLIDTVHTFSYDSSSGAIFRGSIATGGEGSDRFNVVISSNAKIIASNGNRTIKIWDLPNGQIIHTIPNSMPITAFAISPDGQMIGSGYDDTTIKIWDLRTGELLGTLGNGVVGTLASLFSNKNSVTCIAFNPDGQTIATGSLDKTIKIWSLQTGKVIRTLEGHSQYVEALAFSASGSTLVSSSGDNTINIWQ